MMQAQTNFSAITGVLALTGMLLALQPAAAAPEVVLSAAQKEQINPEQYKRSCQMRQPAACFNYGMLYAAGMGIPQDLATAAQIWRLGCQNKEGESCRALADAYHRGAGVDKDLREARELMLKACSMHDSLACTDLGSANEQGTMGMRQNFRQAAGLYNQGCDLGNASACFSLGQLYQKGMGVDRSTVNAILFYQKSCKLGNQEACEAVRNNGEAGVMTAEYVKTLEQSCLNEKAAGFCVIAGYVYHDGQGPDGVNFEKAYQMWEAGCDNNNAESCLMQGRMIYLGEVAEDDMGYALSLLEKGCNFGNPESCYQLSRCYALGMMEAERDHETAAKLCSRSCEQSHALSCFRLGQYYERGQGVRGSLKLAERYYGRACNLDIEQGCDKLKRLGDRPKP